MGALSSIGAYDVEKSTNGGEIWTTVRCYLGSWVDRCLSASIDLGESVWVHDDGTLYRMPIAPQSEAPRRAVWDRQALSDKLTQAYHVIYDVKDEAIEHMRINEGDPTCQDADRTRYKAYETLNELAALMTMLGFTPPDRKDGELR